MSEWVACPVCGSEVHNSHAGWTRDSESARHRFVLMGLSPAEADRIAQSCYDAGVSFEAAMSAIRFALQQPPDELARKAQALRDFAASLD